MRRRDASGRVWGQVVIVSNGPSGFVHYHITRVPGSVGCWSIRFVDESTAHTRQIFFFPRRTTASLASLGKQGRDRLGASCRGGLRRVLFWEVRFLAYLCFTFTFTSLYLIVYSILFEMEWVIFKQHILKASNFQGVQFEATLYQLKLDTRVNG